MPGFKAIEKEASKIQRPIFGRPDNEDHSILGSIYGPLFFGNPDIVIDEVSALNEPWLGRRASQQGGRASRVGVNYKPCPY